MKSKKSAQTGSTRKEINTCIPAKPEEMLERETRKLFDALRLLWIGKEPKLVCRLEGFQHTLRA